MTKPILVELTPKKYKKWMIIGKGIASLGFVGGVMAMFSQNPENALIGIPVVIVGLGINMVAEILAWWNNG